MPEQSIEALMELAAAHHRSGRLREAEQLYRQILLRDPDQADALHGMGLLAQQVDRHELAAAYFSRAVQCNPSVGVFHYNQGEAWMSAGEMSQAAACFRHAIQLEPKRPHPYATLGIALLRLNCADQAIDPLQKAIELGMKRPEVYLHLFEALFKCNRAAEAEAAARAVIELGPGVPDGWVTLGQALGEQNKVEEAVASFRRAIQLNSDFAAPHYGLAVALARKQQVDEAIASFHEALRLQPDFPEALAGLGSVLSRQKRYDEGLEYLRKAVRLNPTLLNAQWELSLALEKTGRREEAIAALRKVQELSPGDRGVEFQIAALSGQSAPDAMPHSMVRDMFDRHADTFDRHLLNRLQYRVPQLLLDAVGGVGINSRLRVLDLGCGTGLCGELFRPMATNLIGVDISAGMLEKARQRGVYDRLDSIDIVAALRAEPAAYDLVLAADVLCYLGDLSEVFASAAEALRPGGIFAISVELHDGTGWVLRATRRYAHSADYIRQLTAQSGLEVRHFKPEVLRTEAAQDVNGLIAVLRR